MPQIGSLLFEAISYIPDYIVITELTIGLEFAQIYQFGQRSIRLMLSNFIDLSLHLDSVTVVVIDARIILGVRISFLDLLLACLIIDSSDTRANPVFAALCH